MKKRLVIIENVSSERTFSIYFLFISLKSLTDIHLDCTLAYTYSYIRNFACMEAKMWPLCAKKNLSVSTNQNIGLLGWTKSSLNKQQDMQF